MPELSSHPKIIAIANQKGGVGKTTTAINLAAALSERDSRVLLLDLDPQGNASTGLGISPTDRTSTTYDFVIGDEDLSSILQPTPVANTMLAPATTDLASADLAIAKRENRTGLLRSAFMRNASTLARFDHILIDCPPSLNLLTLNALVAANSVLVPLQSEFFALEGLSQLLLTVREVREASNPDLRIEGILLTMYDRRNNLSQQVEKDARDTMGKMVFETVIPRNVRISEAPSFALPVLSYDTASRGAAAYRALAREVLRNQDAMVSAGGVAQ